MSPLRMAATAVARAAARPPSSSCTSEIDAGWRVRSHFAWTFPLKPERSDQAKASRCLATKASNGERGPSPDLFHEIVGPGEHPVRVVDGDLA
jgi:hypothetical protein